MATQKRPDYLPDWATSPSSGGDIVRPDASRRADGWNATEKPPAPWMNWWQNLAYQWIEYVQRLYLLNYTKHTLSTATNTLKEIAVFNFATDTHLPLALIAINDNQEDSDRVAALYTSFAIPLMPDGAKIASTIPSIGGGTGRTIQDINVVAPEYAIAVGEVDGVMFVWRSTNFGGSFSNVTLPGSLTVSISAATAEYKRGARCFRASSTDKIFVWSRDDENYYRSTTAAATAFDDLTAADSTKTVGLWSLAGDDDVIVTLDDAGVIYKCTDGDIAGSATMLTSGAAFSAGAGDLAGNADGSLLIACLNSVVFISTDVGENWINATGVYPPSGGWDIPAEGWTCCAAQGNTGVVANVENDFVRLFATYDAGENWECVGVLEFFANTLIQHSLRFVDGQLVFTNAGIDTLISLRA